MKTTYKESKVSINYLIPNKETIEAIRQAREENLEKFKSIKDLMDDLNSNNQQDCWSRKLVIKKIIDTN